jgi:hypothetical protein
VGDDDYGDRHNGADEIDLSSVQEDINKKKLGNTSGSNTIWVHIPRNCYSMRNVCACIYIRGKRPGKILQSLLPYICSRHKLKLKTYKPQ